MKTILIPLLAIALSGCSGEPSESDIKSAFSKEIDKANAFVDRASGGNEAMKTFSKSMKTELKEVKKLGCKEAQDASGYNCDVKVTAVAPLVGETTNTATARLIKGDDGWELVQGN